MILLLGRNTKCVQKLRNPTTQYGKTLCMGVQSIRNKSTTDIETKDYQYIQRGKQPTMFYQDSLPHLPIPKLEESLKKYLNAQKPILPTPEFKRTEEYVAKFKEGKGAVLQQKLIQMDKSNPTGNYISPHWFKMYLSDRKPLPINYNPMLIMAMEDNPKYNAQLLKATNIVISSLRFMRSLKEEVLDPEIYYMNPKVTENKWFHMMTAVAPKKYKAYAAMAFKAFPLDMSQYHNLFCTTRLPREGLDVIYEDNTARHIVVMRNGHFYAFNVLNEDGCIISPKEVASNLKAILNKNAPPNEVPIGILTTSERNTWAKTRKHLENIGNEELLKCIDSSIFLLNLDEDAMEGKYVKLLRNYLHGDGTNRWFDKSLSIIISKDGYAGINFEHSWGDGVAVLRFAKDVKEDISKKPQFHPDDVEQLPEEGGNITKLEFKIDDTIKQAVSMEKKKYDDWRKSLGIDYLIYDGFGKDQCKKFQVSPDAIMQLGFQLAMYNLSQKCVPTYESCSTAVFKLGRTETIRPCTQQTKAACVAMSEKGSMPISELKELIVSCSKSHTNLMKDAATGKGFDRHLFALRKVAEEELNNPLPEIFTDPAYEYLNKNILSTSTLSSPAIMAGGFGPTADDGYGIGYMIQDNKLGTVVTTYRQDQNASDFVQSLGEAFKTIHKVLTHK